MIIHNVHAKQTAQFVRTIKRRPGIAATQVAMSFNLGALPQAASGGLLVPLEISRSRKRCHCYIIPRQT